MKNTTDAVASIQLPRWISNDDDHDEDSSSSEQQQQQQQQQPQWSQNPIPMSLTVSFLEKIPPDVSVCILHHLSVQEITQLTVVSKSMYHATHNPELWKLKFCARWNYLPAVSSHGTRGHNVMTTPKNVSTTTTTTATETTTTTSSSSSSSLLFFDWFDAYQQAYKNTHDLWITHWNCVDPLDGLIPGRCCIQSRHFNSTLHTTISNPFHHLTRGQQQHLCPVCRFHPFLHSSCWQHSKQQQQQQQNSPSNTVLATRAQAMAAATNLRIQQMVINPSNEHSNHNQDNKDNNDDNNNNNKISVTPYSSARAKRAFAVSSTLHRRIDTDQYCSDSLHFLSDLLFFQVSTNRNHTQQELNDLKRSVLDSDHHDRHTHHHHFPQRHLDASETALHSWHLSHFTNPDYTRPLVWRISIMRKDCFTVFPSEGYLLPGESQVVVFGVKPLASLLTHATQQLNAHREGVPQDLANIYAEEAHLPPAPFLIHYHYATATATETNFQQRTDTDSDTTLIIDPLQNNNNNNSNNNNTPWQRSGQPQQPVRIMYLSAHVNECYTLQEFRQSTLVPLDIHDPRTVAMCAPQLQAFYPKVWKQLNNLEWEQQDSIAARAYRTEPPCHQCGQSWGVRLEELGNAFCLAKLQSEWEKHKRDHEMELLHKRLTQVVQHVQKNNHWTERHHQLCCHIHNRLVDYRCVPWFTQRQREILLSWETAVDLICVHFAKSNNQEDEVHNYFMVPWRHAGVYKNVLCTDSVFQEGSTPLIGNERTMWKEEPRYLEAFAHLAHSPGRFCLGPQEDPNHLRSTTHSRYGRRQRGCVSDMFFDDPACGLQAALCVVSDPRSLMVHGIWDRVPYPGTLIRRPALPSLPKLGSEPLMTRPTNIQLASFIGSHNKLWYYELQNTMDMESLLIVESWFDNSVVPSAREEDKFYPLSFRNYLRNIPPPGMGRFPLSTATLDENGTVRITELILEFEDGMEHGSNDDSNLRQSNGGGGNFGAFDNDDLDGRPGPRILNLLWVLSANLGWTVDDNQGAASVYVDRRILIGAQWLSISLMAAPLGWTLVARYARWIPAVPVDYSLQALPYKEENELRFLTERECGMLALILLLSWLSLGRWIERYTSRDFFRAMLEYVPTKKFDRNLGVVAWLYSKVELWCLRRWDSVCPLFLQRFVFVPNWNRRSQDDLMKHVAFWRSRQDQMEHGTTFQAVSGGGFVFVDSRAGQIQLGEVSWSSKVFIGVLVTLASFAASSPHFFLNLLTVFSSSISLGLSMSLQSMETGRAGVSANATGSIVETLSLVTIVVFGFLVGQLVGSSGGVLFLAEFVVTSISFFLGGAGAVSASTIESWGTFLYFAVTAFWGYLFGRVSIMEGIRQKRSGFSSVMLCLSLIALAVSWFVVIFAWKWESPTELVILRPSSKGHVASPMAKGGARALQ